MPGCLLYTIRDEHTGAFIRYTIVPADVTLGMVGNEAVGKKRPLTDVLGEPVTVAQWLRTKRLTATAEELAVGFFVKRE